MSDTLVLHAMYQQPCCGTPRGSQPNQPVICLHKEQPAHSSPHQLRSFPGLVPLPDTKSVVIIVSFKETQTERSNTACVCVCVSHRGNWLSAQRRRRRSRRMKAPFRIWQVQTRGWTHEHPHTPWPQTERIEPTNHTPWILQVNGVESSPACWVTSADCLWLRF